LTEVCAIIIDMNKWYIWVVALVVVVAGLVAISWVMKPHEVSMTVSPTTGPITPAVAADLATYTNAKGQKWSIPKTGGDAFTVASAAVYPQFISGDVDPVDVSIGETQHMSFVIRDNVPITKAWAEVENDKSTDNIPLALGTSSAVSYNDIQNQKYLVDSTGKLVVNDSVKKDSKVADLVQSLFQKAQAEQAVDYAYAGSWVVHDTRTINYHTTFYVEDNLGRTAEAVLVWSDPCGVSGGLLQGDCSLTLVWGLDGTGQNLAIGNNTLSLVSSTPANLVYNNGNSITLISGSKIAIGTGTEITKANLFYADADGDGYAPNNTMSYNTASSLSGYVRVSSALGTSDCDDVASTGYYVHPGQTSYFFVPVPQDGSVASGTWNYNCGATTAFGPGSQNTYNVGGGQPGWIGNGNATTSGWQFGNNSTEAQEVPYPASSFKQYIGQCKYEGGSSWDNCSSWLTWSSSYQTNCGAFSSYTPDCAAGNLTIGTVYAGIGTNDTTNGPFTCIGGERFSMCN
jgi:hypothetical protein